MCRRAARSGTQVRPHTIHFRTSTSWTLVLMLGWSFHTHAEAAFVGASGCWGGVHPHAAHSTRNTGRAWARSRRAALTKATYVLTGGATAGVHTITQVEDLSFCLDEGEINDVRCYLRRCVVQLAYTRTLTGHGVAVHGTASGRLHH